MSKRLKDILTKEFLQDRCIEKGQSAREIGKELQCTGTTVMNYMRRHGIPLDHQGVPLGRTKPRLCDVCEDKKKAEIEALEKGRFESARNMMAAEVRLWGIVCVDMSQTLEKCNDYRSAYKVCRAIDFLLFGDGHSALHKSMGYEIDQLKAFASRSEE